MSKTRRGSNKARWHMVPNVPGKQRIAVTALNPDLGATNKCNHMEYSTLLRILLPLPRSSFDTHARRSLKQYMKLRISDIYRLDDTSKDFHKKVLGLNI
jgi:hypothetical protein